MSKLYPPIISGTIPAFYGDQIVVPFSMNKAVGKTEISGFALKIKTVSGDFKGILTESTYDVNSNMEVYFPLHNTDLEGTFTIGQFYKIQLAYIDISGNIGYYSTVGIVKYTSMPVLSIESLQFGQINTHRYTYTGVYSQKDGDTTEKMYSYMFKIYDENGEIISDTGEILHDTSKDDSSYEQIETFTLPHDLERDKTYYIQFFTKTINNLSSGFLSTSRYRISQKTTISPELNGDLIATLNQDNGYIKLFIENGEIPRTGMFLLSRGSLSNNFYWEELHRLSLDTNSVRTWEFKDFTIEQGETYIYSLQQYSNKGIYSERIVSNKIYSTFEDTFLFDGDKQLKIRFNPKVSTFKNTILESKTDTIGSKYPFITRNGHVNYKELSLAGLISFQEDEEELFLTKKEIGLEEECIESVIPIAKGSLEKYNEYMEKASAAALEEDRQSYLEQAREELKAYLNNIEYETKLIKYHENYNDLTPKNIAAERRFKLKVMDWLTNGKIKLFKSPAEGNYIVRLMNVSLSPIDSLGRMIHNFNSSAYEVDEFSLKNLEKYSIASIQENFELRTQYGSKDLTTIENKENKNLVQIVNTPVYGVRFEGMLPGTLIYIEQEPIVIGATGTYEFNSTTPIYSIFVEKSGLTQGIVTYTYKTKVINSFGSVTNIVTIDVPIYQAIGKNYKTEKLVYNNGIDWGKNGLITEEEFKNEKTMSERDSILYWIPRSDNLIKYLSNTKQKATKINFMRFQKRPAKYLYLDTVEPISSLQELSSDIKFYEDMDCKNEITVLEPICLYKFRTKRNNYLNIPNEGYYVQAMEDLQPFTKEMDFGIDGYNNEFFKWNENIFKFVLDEDEYDFMLSDKEEFIINEPEFESVVPERGIITEVSYYKQEITYAFEDPDSPEAYRTNDGVLLETLKNNYLVALQQYLQADVNREEYRKKEKELYEIYIRELTNAKYFYEGGKI